MHLFLLRYLRWSKSWHCSLPLIAALYYSVFRTDKYGLRFSSTRENVMLGQFFHEKLWEFPGQGLFSCLITSCLFRLLLRRSGQNEPVKEGLDALSSSMCIALREQIFNSSSSVRAHLLQRQDNDVGFNLLSALSGRWGRTLAPADLQKKSVVMRTFYTNQLLTFPPLTDGSGLPGNGQQFTRRWQVKDPKDRERSSVNMGCVFTYVYGLSLWWPRVYKHSARL